MKKVMLIGFALAVLLVGCAKKPETLKVLMYSNATDPAYPVEQQIWANFKKANPDVKLEIEELFNDPFHDKVLAYAAADKLPDVMYMWPSGRSSMLYNKKLVKDLGPLLAPIKDNFLPAAMAIQTNGIIGEIPFTVTNTNAIYVNKKMLADLGLQVPTTYAELKAQVPVIKKAGKEVMLIPAKSDWVFQSCLFSMISGRVAGDKFIDDALAGNAKFTDKPFVDALKFFAQLFKDGVIDKKDISIDYGEGPGLFAAGKAPYYIDGEWRTGAFITDKTTNQALIAPDKQGDYTIVGFPAIPGELAAGSCSTVVGTGFGMNAKIPAGSEKEKAAWKLIQYWVGPEVAKMRLEAGAFARASWKGVTSDKLEPLSVTTANYEPKASTYVLDGVLDAQVAKTVNVGLQEIGLGTKTPEQVAADVQKSFEAWKAGNK